MTLSSKKGFLIHLQRSKFAQGFTLIEIMIVVAIVAILGIMAIFLLTSNIGKSRDGRRKADLARIKTAFEEYYGDKNTYPADTALATCGSTSLRPYLETVPCDPKTKRPYCYIYDATTNGQNYKILSSLEIDSDPIIAQLNCNSPTEYCGYETECASPGYVGFNYGVSSSNVVVVSENIGQIITSPTPTPSPSPSMPLPSTVPGVHACSKAGICNTYADPYSAPHLCPLTFADESCNFYCDSAPAYARCAD